VRALGLVQFPVDEGQELVVDVRLEIVAHLLGDAVGPEEQLEGPLVVAHQPSRVGHLRQRPRLGPPPPARPRGPQSPLEQLDGPGEVPQGAAAQAHVHRRLGRLGLLAGPAQEPERLAHVLLGPGRIPQPAQVDGPDAPVLASLSGRAAELAVPAERVLKCLERGVVPRCAVQALAQFSQHAGHVLGPAGRLEQVERAAVGGRGFLEALRPRQQRAERLVLGGHREVRRVRQARQVAYARPLVLRGPAVLPLPLPAAHQKPLYVRQHEDSLALVRQHGGLGHLGEVQERGRRLVIPAGIEQRPGDAELLRKLHAAVLGELLSAKPQQADQPHSAPLARRQRDERPTNGR